MSLGWSVPRHRPRSPSPDLDGSSLTTGQTTSGRTGRSTSGAKDLFRRAIELVTIAVAFTDEVFQALADPTNVSPAFSQNALLVAMYVFFGVGSIMSSCGTRGGRAPCRNRRCKRNVV